MNLVRPEPPFVTMKKVRHLNIKSREEKIIKNILLIVIGAICILFIANFVKRLIAKHSNGNNSDSYRDDSSSSNGYGYRYSPGTKTQEQKSFGENALSKKVYKDANSDIDVSFFPKDDQ